MISKLYFASVLVGDLADPLEHQGTWFASFTTRLPGAGGNGTEARIWEFIRFCEDWHGRLGTGSDPDAKEFDAFEDIVKSDLLVYALQWTGIVIVAIWGEYRRRRSRAA